MKKAHVDTDYEYRPGDPVPFTTTAVQQHVALLRYFCKLIDHVKSSASLTVARAQAVAPHSQDVLAAAQRVEDRALRVFLSSAEFRYKVYVDMITEVINKSKADGQEIALDALPLPPWDVAIVMHSHMLSSFRFVEDFAVRPVDTAVWGAGIVFPLRRLSALLTEGSWSDKASEERWDEYSQNMRYQMWDKDPDKGGSYSLVLPVLLCTKCKGGVSFEYKGWAYYLLDNGTIFCGACQKRYSIATEKIEQLREAFGEYIKNPDADSALKSMKGVGVDKRTGTPRHRQVATDLRRLDLPRTALWSYLSSGDPDKREWEKVFNAARITHARSAASDFPVNDRNLLISICRAYYRSPFLGFLGIDLVAAVLRQQSFARKIIALDEWDSQDKLAPMSDRYLKFMLLMKKPEKGRVKSLVPTLSVDLFWHTHQLFPKYYHSWCLQNVGRRINHDDTIEQPQLKASFEDTQKMWKDAYSEDYVVGHKKNHGAAASPPVAMRDGSLAVDSTCNDCLHAHLEPECLKTAATSTTLQLTEIEQNTLLNEMTVQEERTPMCHELARQSLESRLNASKDSTHKDPSEMILPAMILVAERALASKLTPVIRRKLKLLSQFPFALAVLEKMGDDAITGLEKRLTNDDDESLNLYDLVTTEQLDIMDWYLAKLYVDAEVKKLDSTGDGGNKTGTTSTQDRATKRRALREVDSEIRSKLEQLRESESKSRTENNSQPFDAEKWATHLQASYPKLFNRCMQEAEVSVNSMLENAILADTARVAEAARLAELVREEAEESTAYAAMASELLDLRLGNLRLEEEIQNQPSIANMDADQLQQERVELSARLAEQRSRERIARDDMAALDRAADLRADQCALERSEQRMRSLNLSNQLTAERDALRRRAEEMEALVERRRGELSAMIERRRQEAETARALQFSRQIQTAQLNSQLQAAAMFNATLAGIGAAAVPTIDTSFSACSTMVYTCSNCTTSDCTSTCNSSNCNSSNCASNCGSTCGSGCGSGCGGGCGS